LSEIDVFRKEKGHICYISYVRQQRQKKGHQKFSALKWQFLLKKGRSKIWFAKVFLPPPNSAPGLRPCMYLAIHNTSMLRAFFET